MIVKLILILIIIISILGGIGVVIGCINKFLRKKNKVSVKEIEEIIKDNKNAVKDAKEVIKKHEKLKNTKEWKFKKKQPDAIKKAKKLLKTWKEKNE